MKDKKYAKLAWAAIVLASLYLFWPFGKPNLNRSDSDATVAIDIKTVDSLRKIIATYESTQNQYDDKLESLRDSIKNLKFALRNNEIKIKEQNEKVNNVPKLSTDDIVKFLSDRYKDK
jgi:hypothetical protein